MNTEPARSVPAVIAGYFPRTRTFTTYSWAVVALTMIALWLAFAALVVPPLIDSAYRGESLSFLNNVISGRAQHSVDFYLQLWRVNAIRVLAGLVVFWVLAAVMSRDAFFRRCVGNATPGTLGAIRMWVCVILLMTTMWDDLGSIALLPLEYRTQMGTMRLFEMLPIGFEHFLTSEASLRAFQRVTELLLFLGALGWNTRIVIPLCALATYVMNGILREYTGFWHQNLVPIYVLIVLSFTRCADGWSIDRLRRIAQGRPVVDAEQSTAVYGWARYACWVPIALTYASAGFSKLRATGLDWVSARNMKGLLFEQTLYQRSGNFSISLHLTSAPDIVFVLLAAIALAGEVFFIAVLFSRVCRRIFPGLMILMHAGIIFLQNIVFFDLMLLLLIFYDFHGVRDKIARWVGRNRSIYVMYDGACPLCMRTVRTLKALDLFGRLELEDFRSVDLATFNKKHNTQLTVGVLEHEMYVQSGGRAVAGFEAYRVLAFALPAIWPIAGLLSLPGVRALGRALYDRIARNRLTLLECGGRCSAVVLADSERSTSTAGRSLSIYAATIAIVIAVQSYFWLNKIEFYPFTSVQMFAGKPGTVVTYYKTLGHWNSGRVTPFNLEDTVGVMSINSRYEGLFDLCFGDEKAIALCDKTLAIMGTAYNNRAGSRDTLSSLEIQRWSWDFGANPSDPNYGHLEARYVGGATSENRHAGIESVNH